MGAKTEIRGVKAHVVCLVKMFQELLGYTSICCAEPFGRDTGLHIRL